MMKLFRQNKEIVLYLIFGIATTIVNWMIYCVMTGVFCADMTISNVIAWIGAIFFAFITNKVFVFESKDISGIVLAREMVTFLGSRIFSGIFEIFLPTFLFSLGLQQTLFGIKAFWAKAIVSIIVVVLNYVFSKLIVFRRNTVD